MCMGEAFGYALYAIMLFYFLYAHKRAFSMLVYAPALSRTEHTANTKSGGTVTGTAARVAVYRAYVEGR